MAQSHEPNGRGTTRELAALAFASLLLLAALATPWLLQRFRLPPTAGPSILPGVPIPVPLSPAQRLLLLASTCSAALCLLVRTRRAGGSWRDGAFPQAVLESASVAVAVVSGRENRLDLANAAYRRLIGRLAEVVAGLKLREVLPQPVAKAAEHTIAQVYRTGNTLTVREIPLQTGEPPETTFWDVDYIPLRRPDGRVDAVLMQAVPVTERVRARRKLEAQAREGEERAAQLQAVLGAIPEMVWAVDADLRLTYVNDEALRQLGLAPAPDLYERLTEAARSLERYWPDGRRMVVGERPVDRALRGETIIDQDVQYRLPGRPSLNWARVSTAPLRDASGRITGAVLIELDTTAQKEAQAEPERLLAQTQALATQAQERASELQAVLSAISESIWVFDASGNVRYVNEATARQLGVEPSPAVLQSLGQVAQSMELYHPDGTPIQGPDRHVARALRGEAFVGEEFQYRLPGQPMRWARASAAPIRDAQGRPSGAVVTATDATAEKEAQAERERLLAEVEGAHRNLQTILNRLPDGVMAIDRAERVTLSNDTFRRWLHGDPVGRSLQELSAHFRLETPDGRPIPWGQLPVQRALRGESVSGAEVRLRLPDGSYVYMLESSAPLYGPNGQREIIGAVLTGTDITAQKQAQAERERLLAEVESARENLQTILNHLPDGVMVVDTAQRIVSANDTVRRYLGRDVLGLSLADLRREYAFAPAPGQVFPPEQTPLERALHGVAAIGVEVVLRLPDGRRLNVLESAAPLYGPDGRIRGAVLALTDITALKEAQAERERLLAEVQAAHRNLQTILARLPDGVVVLDASLRVAMSNDAIRRFLGYDVAGMALADLDRVFTPRKPSGEPIPGPERPTQRVLSGEPQVSTEAVVLLPDSRRITLLLSAAALYGPGGRRDVRGVVVTATDITPQKEAQAERERLLAEVQAAHRNLQTILARLPDGVAVMDSSLRVVMSNDIIRQFLGHDLAGMTLADLEHEFQLLAPTGEPLPAEAWPVLRTLRGETVTGLETRVQLLDRRQVDLLFSAAPLYGPDGGPGGRGRLTGVAITVADITPLKRAEAERERLLAEVEGTREKLRTIIDRLPDGVLVADRSLRVTLSNEAIRRYLGRRPEGISIFDLHRQYRLVGANGQPFPEGQTPFERCLRGEMSIGVEARMQLPQGRQVDVLASAAPLYGPDGQVREVAIVLTDITPLKELDRAKDEFISVAAHELRTPLTSLKGHTQMLMRRAEKAHWRPEDRRSLETIDNQVDRLNDLIARLLDVSRIRLGRLELRRVPTDLAQVAREVREELQVTTEAHRITVRAEPPRVEGLWDPAAMRQVLVNLVGNAIKHTPGGPIEVHLRQEDARAVVSVTDRGPGIPPERLSRLFEAFTPGVAEEYRKAKGLGLGLYISRGIVEAHGGRIWVESQPGVGSTFTFALPIDASPG